MASTYRYPADMADLNAAARLDTFSSSRSKMKDLMVLRVIDSSDTNFNPYSNTGTGNNAASAGATKASIWLYMPQAINASYSIEYADLNLGAIGRNVLGNLEQYKNSNDATALGESLKSLATDMMPEVKMGTIGNAIGLAQSGLGLEGSQLSGSDVSALAERKAFNPYLENVFKGLGFRQHPFQFKFLVRSKAEGQQVKGIIKTLKQAMHPDFEAGSTKFLKIPDLFEIKFVRNRGDSNTEVLYKFKPCVLTSLNVNYTPDGYYAVPGDPWTNDWDNISLSVDIQMQFKETQILTKKDFDAEIGY